MNEFRRNFVKEMANAASVVDDEKMKERKQLGAPRDPVVSVT
jgi:hypothetical protein